MPRAPRHGAQIREQALSTQDALTGLLNREGLAREMREHEQTLGYRSVERYLGFGEQVREAKRGLLSFLIEAKRQGKNRVVWYDAVETQGVISR